VFVESLSDVQLLGPLFVPWVWEVVVEYEVKSQLYVPLSMSPEELKVFSQDAVIVQVVL